MTHLIIENEGDMERGLSLATKLAIQGTDEKYLDISFPSKFLSKVFINNLVIHWYEERIPADNGLNINIYIPDEGDAYENDYQM